jgi:hypothetical protein
MRRRRTSSSGAKETRGPAGGGVDETDVFTLRSLFRNDGNEATGGAKPQVVK